MFIKTRNNLKLSHCQLFSLFSSTFFILSQFELEFCASWSRQDYSLQWGETKLHILLNQNVQFLYETKVKNVKCFVLALLHTRQMSESYVIIVSVVFFLIAPIWGPFFLPFFKTKAFWKEKPNFQIQKFCFFLWHFHHKALCLWLHWNAVFWHFAVWMSD